MYNICIKIYYPLKTNSNETILKKLIKLYKNSNNVFVIQNGIYAGLLDALLYNKKFEYSVLIENELYVEEYFMPLGGDLKIKYNIIE